MGLYDIYGTDTTLEDEGAWVQMSADVAVKVRPLDNPDAQKYRRNLEKPYQGWREIPSDKTEEIIRKVMAKHVIVDWKGVTDPKGKTLPCNPENVEKVLKDLRHFARDLIMVATTPATFQAEAAEKIEGN